MIQKLICNISQIRCECSHYTACYLNLIMHRLSLRIFNDTIDPSVMWKKSVKDINGEILCVSQFTLMANTTKGNKPDFHRAMVC